MLCRYDILLSYLTDGLKQDEQVSWTVTPSLQDTTSTSTDCPSIAAPPRLPNIWASVMKFPNF